MPRDPGNPQAGGPNPWTHARIGLALWVLVILALSLYPWRIVPFRPIYIPLSLSNLTAGEYLDGVLNFWFYVPLGLLVFVAAGGGRWAMLGSAAVGLALTSAVEYLQHWVPGRAPSGNDLLLNFVGSCAGGGTAWLAMRSGRWRHLNPLLRSPRWHLPREEWFIVGLWILAEGFPLVPSFRRSQLFASWANLQHLSATWPEMGAICASFLALAMLVSQPRWVAIAFLVLPAQIVIQQRVASPGRMCAALVGWFLAAVLKRYGAGRAAGWLVLAWVVANELRPFRFVGPLQAMTFLPGEGVFSIAESYLVTLAGKLFLFAACLLLFKRMGHGLLAPAVGLCLFIALGEWLQRYLPGRTPETTDPLLVLLAAGLLVALPMLKAPGRRS